MYPPEVLFYLLVTIAIQKLLLQARPRKHPFQHTNLTMHFYRFVDWLLLYQFVLLAFKLLSILLAVVSFNVTEEGLTFTAVSCPNAIWIGNTIGTISNKMKTFVINSLHLDQ